MDEKRTGDFSPDILTDQYLVYQLDPLHQEAYLGVTAKCGLVNEIWSRVMLTLLI